jgi:monosaccharide-transporting ATPase
LSDSAPLLAMRGIVKRFPGMVALDQVDFTLRAGEVHAVMGENGAGKSTLIKVMTGVYRPDEGTIELDGNAIDPTSPEHAAKLGISTVYQEVNLAPNLSVAENICLGREPRGRLGIKWAEVARRADAALEKLSVKIDSRRSLNSYSIAIQQMIALARALAIDAKVLVLDEPTSSLDKQEVAQLFETIHRLRDQGMGIVFITHFLDQVYAVSDRITVLRNGRSVASDEASKIDRPTLVRHMIGRDQDSPLTERSATAESAGPSLLEAHNAGLTGSVDHVNVTVRQGEILGFAGLLGSGRTETLNLVFGVDPLGHGKLSWFGKSVAKPTMRSAIRSGIGFCTEDRKLSGIIPDLSIRENIILVLQSQRGWLKPIPLRRQNQIADDMIQKLRIATNDAEKQIQYLSGGNQQKALLARWLATDPRLLLLDEPTRGIDIGAKFDIANLIEDRRSKGMGFVFVSSELSEVVNLSQRVAVFRDRQMVQSLAGEEITEDGIMAIIAEASH